MIWTVLFFIMIAAIYALVVFYVLYRYHSFCNACVGVLDKKVIKWGITGIVCFMALSIVIAFFIPTSMPEVSLILHRISNYWLGTLLYILLSLGIADITRLILKLFKALPNDKEKLRRIHVVVGCAAIIITGTLSIYGVVHVSNIKLTTYNTQINKTCATGDMKIINIADFHLGYSVGARQMQKMVDKVNAENADLVCIAGDIFDNDYDALYKPDEIAQILSGIKSRYGVYACYGNHDVSEKILGGFTFHTKQTKTQDDRMKQFLEKANIKILADESELIADSFYVIGRRDYEKPGIDGERKTIEELTNGLDKTKPIIVIDHEPKELQEKADSGVDIDLGGHTHNGQMFPGNLTIKLMWENATGILKKDDMYSIVTSGIGVWGPNMRVGTDSEIVSVNVDFAD